MRFDPTGQNIASGSFDRSICRELSQRSPPTHYIRPQFADKAIS